MINKTEDSMNLYFNIINRNVNIESYSSSKLFLGFFERKTKYNISVVNAAVNLFYDKLLKEEKTINIVSSLFVNEDLDELAKQYNISAMMLKKRINTIHCLGLIKLVNFNKLAEGLSGYDDPLYSKRLDDFCKSWTLIQINDAISLRRVLCDYLIVDGICGHLFIVLEDKSIIAYPHNDETGFGFIGYNFAQNKRTRRSLELDELFTNNGFRFVKSAV